MALITLPFTVTGQQLEFSQPVLAEHAVGSIGATFSFSGEWATLTTRTATFATFGKGIVNGKANTHLFAMCCKQSNLFIRIGSIFIESHYYLLTEALQVLDMFVKIGKSFFQSLDISLFDFGFRNTTVHLQSLSRSNNNRQLGR